MYRQEVERTRQTQEQLASNAYETLRRTNESLQRSNQIAYETEQVGTQVLSDLDEQRQTLLRAQDRLTDTEENLTRSGRILRKLRNEVLYNKIVLILIIIVEVFILSGLIAIKFLK